MNDNIKFINTILGNAKPSESSRYEVGFALILQSYISKNKDIILGKNVKIINEELIKFDDKPTLENNDVVIYIKGGTSYEDVGIIHKINDIEYSTLFDTKKNDSLSTTANLIGPNPLFNNIPNPVWYVGFYTPPTKTKTSLINLNKKILEDENERVEINKKILEKKNELEKGKEKEKNSKTGKKIKKLITLEKQIKNLHKKIAGIDKTIENKNIRKMKNFYYDNVGMGSIREFDFDYINHHDKINFLTYQQSNLQFMSNINTLMEILKNNQIVYSDTKTFTKTVLKRISFINIISSIISVKRLNYYTNKNNIRNVLK